MKSQKHKTIRIDARGRAIAQQRITPGDAVYYERRPDFRAAIRQAMADREMTQAELASMAGVAQQHVSRYLTGGREITTATLARLASVLGLVLTEWER